MVLSDADAMSKVWSALWEHWMLANIPRACGQSDDDFDELLNAVRTEFDGALDRAIEVRGRDSGAHRALRQLSALLMNLSAGYNQFGLLPDGYQEAMLGLACDLCMRVEDDLIAAETEATGEPL
jgi:hypothetical protein